MSLIESQLVERWQELKEKNPDAARDIKKIICVLYEVRDDREKFDQGLVELQEELSNGVLKILSVNVSDKQALSLWAQTMGFIFLIAKERELKTGPSS